VVSIAIPQPVVQNQSSSFTPFASGTLHCRKSPPVVRFSVGVLVIEVSTEPWWWWYFATRSGSGASPNTRFLTAADPKYRSRSGLCMTKKLPTGVLMDGVVIPWSNAQNSLSSIPNTTNIEILASRSPRAPPNIAPTADILRLKCFPPVL